MTIDGPKTPPDPPDEIVSDVVRIFTSATVIKSIGPTVSPAVNNFCRRPYPLPRTASASWFCSKANQSPTPTSPASAAPMSGFTWGGMESFLKRWWMP